MELLIVVAIIAILVAISIPYLSGQLEKAREATDLANVRAAYAEVMVAAIEQDTSSELYDSVRDRYFKSVDLVQKKDGWATNADTLNIGGVSHSDSIHWKGDAKANGKCVVMYDNKKNDVTLIWNGYSVYINYQWKVDNSGRFYVSTGSFDESRWPASAVPEFINAKNNAGQKVVVDKITDKYPTLKKWIDSGGGYEIGIFIVDSDGKELADTGGQYISAENATEYKVATDKADDGADVKLAIQFFKMNSGTNHGAGSVKMTEQEARELEQIFTITD